MNKSVIIVAGGTGTRMNSITPKQFLLLGGKPMLMHSLGAFSRACPGISMVLVLPEDQFPRWQELCLMYSFDLPHLLVAGGETRFDSVKNALAVTGDDGLVAIHDGARPLISGTLILSAFEAAGEYGNCVPVVPLNESLRIVGENASQPFDRHKCRVVQTPQVFPAAILQKAYRREFREEFTDDATVVESAGGSIHLAPGDPVNIKITYPADVAIAEALLGRMH